MSSGRDEEDGGSDASDDTMATSNIAAYQRGGFESSARQGQQLQPYGAAEQTHVSDDDRSDLPPEEIAAERRRQRNARKRARQKARTKSDAIEAEEDRGSSDALATELAAIQEDAQQLSLVTYVRSVHSKDNEDDDFEGMEASFAVADEDTRVLFPINFAPVEESHAIVPYTAQGEGALVPAQTAVVIPAPRSLEIRSQGGVQQNLEPVKANQGMISTPVNQELAVEAVEEQTIPALSPSLGGSQGLVVPYESSSALSMQERDHPAGSVRALDGSQRLIVPYDPDAPSGVENAGILVPAPRGIGDQHEEQALALASAETENQLTLLDSNTFHTSTSMISKGTKGTMGSGWEKYDERTISSLQSDEDQPVPGARQDQDEVSLTPSDVFSKNAQAPPKVGDDETGDTTDESGKSKLKRTYDDEISTDQDQEDGEYHDDESTINTYGSNYWTSMYPNKPSLHQPQETVTILEEDEDDEEYARDSQQNSSGYPEKFAKEFKDPSNASFNESWRSNQSGGQYSTSGGESSVRSSSSRGGRGIVERLAHAKVNRRDRSREVEVSLDGFMHQPRPVQKDRSLGEMRPFIDISRDERVGKLSNLYRYCTLFALLGLVTAMTFFAVHIGPFHVQAKTESKVTTGTTQGAQGTQSAQSAELIPGTTTSTGFLAVGPVSSEDGATLNSTATNEAGEIIGIPLWMARTFVNWRSRYLGVSSEVPFIWAHEKSGADIVVETLTVCVGKVIAGDGKKYDAEGKHTQEFNDNNIKLLSSPFGYQYLNVDLLDPKGIDRAGALGITQNRYSELLYTPFLRHGAEALFVPRSGSLSPTVSGRLFVIFRDPIERALNRYESTRLSAGQDGLTLSKYATDPIYSENNPLTRGLLGLTPTDRIEQDQIRVAQEIINKHVFVGLFNKMEETITRYEQFLHWYASRTTNPQIVQCHEEVVKNFEGGYRVNSNYAESDPIGFNLVAASHVIDKIIYGYARAVFDLQERTMADFSSRTS